MELKVAICDDDATTLKEEYCLIKSILEGKNIDFQFDFFENPQSLLAATTSYDIIFLDIELGEINGIDIGKKLIGKHNNIYIFFITNYPAYIDSAFDIKAHRYLSKPIDKQRLSNGLDSALKKLHDSIKLLTLVNEDIEENVRVPISSILYIENIKRQTKVYLISGTAVITNEIFSKVKNKIESEVDFFAMPHQSYYVNMRYVDSYDKKSIVIVCGEKTCKVDVSRRGYVEFNQKMFEQAKLC